MTTDREILLAAQARARQVLSASTDNAAALLARSDRRAANDLLRESELAARLLLQEQEQATHAGEDAKESTKGMSQADAEAYRERYRNEAATLEAVHERTARELSRVERTLAARVGEAMAAAATDILMDGHREAAAILLEARMRVTDNR